MFRKKLFALVALILLLVTGFLVTSLVSYFVARDSLSSQIADQSLPLTSDNIYSEIQRDLLSPVLISSLMASDTFLRDWVIAGEDDSESVRLYLAEIQQSYNTITAFFISERTRTYYHSTGILKQVDVNLPEDAWYARVRTLGDPYEINIDNDTFDRSRLSIFINYRVLDYDGNFIGATGVGLAVSSVTQMINNYQQRFGRTIYFVDRLGKITLTGNSGNAPQEAQLQERPGLGSFASQVLNNPSASLTYINQTGDEVYLNSRLVPEFNWYLVVEEDENAATDTIAYNLWINTGLALGIMLLVLFGAHFSLKTWQGQLEQMATTDQLTGVGNRHLFEALFEQARKRSQRELKPLCLVAIDIDHFKLVNDNWGHQGGDVVLNRLAELIQSGIRASDLVCRWGGEEFLLLLDNCELPEAVERARTISAAVRELQITFGRENIKVTISCGVAACKNNETLEDAIARADLALYDAKGKGRDLVCSAPV